MSAPYDLTAAELDAGWSRIRRLVDFAHEPSPTPTVVFLGAQPAAGKSVAQSRIDRWYGRSFLAVDSDELRQHHPRFEHIAATDPVRLPVLVNQAASEWTRRLIGYAREHHIDTIVENTFHNPDTIVDSATQFRQAGYHTHVVALAVPPEVSRLAMVDRFTTSHQAGDLAARWTTRTAHDKAATGVVDTVTRIHATGAADRLTIVDRTGDRRLDVTAGTDDWATADPSGVLHATRDAYWTDTTRAAHVRTYTAVIRYALDAGLVAESTRSVFAALAADADRVAGHRLVDDPDHARLHRTAAELDARTARSANVTDLFRATRAVDPSRHTAEPHHTTTPPYFAPEPDRDLGPEL